MERPNWKQFKTNRHQNLFISAQSNGSSQRLTVQVKDPNTSQVWHNAFERQELGGLRSVKGEHEVSSTPKEELIKLVIQAVYQSERGGTSLDVISPCNAPIAVQSMLFNSVSENEGDNADDIIDSTQRFLVVRRDNQYEQKHFYLPLNIATTLGGCDSGSDTATDLKSDLSSRKDSEVSCEFKERNNLLCDRLCRAKQEIRRLRHAISRCHSITTDLDSIVHTNENHDKPVDFGTPLGRTVDGLKAPAPQDKRLKEHCRSQWALPQIYCCDGDPTSRLDCSRNTPATNPQPTLAMKTAKYKRYSSTDRNLSNRDHRPIQERGPSIEARRLRALSTVPSALCPPGNQRNNIDRWPQLRSNYAMPAAACQRPTVKEMVQQPWNVDVARYGDSHGRPPVIPSGVRSSGKKTVYRRKEEAIRLIWRSRDFPVHQ